MTTLFGDILLLTLRENLRLEMMIVTNCDAGGLLLLIHHLHPVPLAPVEMVEVVIVQHAPAVEADQLAPLDVPGDKEPLPLVSAGVHVLHGRAAHLVHFVSFYFDNIFL